MREHREEAEVSVKMVGEMLPDEANRVTLSDDLDQYGLRVARVAYKWGDNDKALIEHALEQMGRSIDAIGVPPTCSARPPETAGAALLPFRRPHAAIFGLYCGLPGSPREMKHRWIAGFAVFARLPFA